MPGEVELQTRIKSLFRSAEDAVAQRDFAKALRYSDEELIERQKLELLYQQYGLLDWLYL